MPRSRSPAHWSQNLLLCHSNSIRGVISHRLQADICEALHFFLVILITLVHTFLVEKAPEFKDRALYSALMN